MKLEFQDKIKFDNINILINLGSNGQDDYVDVSYTNARIKWSLLLKVESWGLDNFDFSLIQLDIPMEFSIYPKDSDEPIIMDLNLQIKPEDKSKSIICRIYKDVNENNKWIEEEFLSFPIKFFVKEQPSTNENRRTMVDIKHIDINISEKDKSLILTI